MKQKKYIHILRSLFILGLIFLLPGMSQADFAWYTNGADNGNEYRVLVTQIDNNTYQMKLEIKVLDSYSGNKWSDVIDAVSLKGFINSYSNFSLIDAPNGKENWTVSQKELSANGFKGGNSGGLGAQANSDKYAAPVSGPDTIFSWIFQFDSNDVINTDAHLKYLYLNSKDKKVGSLGSWDIPIQDPPPSNVPIVPAAWLLGSGLLGLLGYKRKFGR